MPSALHAEPVARSTPTRAAVRAVGLCRSAGGRQLLQGISFTIAEGELVAVLGPSGAGKSLLIELLAGASQASDGYLGLLGLPARELSGRVGYVPQGEIVHDVLTVREALVDTAHLRAPALTAAPELLEARIAAVTERLSLTHRLDVRIARLSGGERRRVSLALELLTDPELLILDEVTSGLDAGAERQVVETLVGLARSGRTIVCTTHTLASVERFDRVLVVYEGRLVFSGSPAATRAWFELDDLDQLYARLREHPPSHWLDRLSAAPVSSLADDAHPRLRVGLPGPPGLYQFSRLLARSLRVTVREGRSLTLLLAQGPVIGLLVAFAYDLSQAAGKAEVAFKLALAAIWLGCIASCQELVKERTIYRRERLAGLSPHAYLAAKTVLVLLLSLVQALALTGALYAWESLSEPPLWTFAALSGAAVAGGALGLLISASVATRTGAVGVTPLVLVPQILFVGTLTPLSGAAARLGEALPSHWGNEAARRVLLDGAGVPARELAVLGAFTLIFLVGAWAVTLVREATEGNAR